ncbi:MAG: T9SS type A sorting domain-containing protein [Bacteroidetes bacterium]|nr:T9SS type A sorting domain-containing protein [Bacteroidota bacterium]
MKLVFTFFFLLPIFCSIAQFQVGHTTITFNDPARTGGFGSGGGSGRQIQTEIYYPAITAGDNVALASGQFPVITFGHGFAMAWDAYSNIWQHYVARGYILAFPRTEGGLIPGPSHGDFGTDLKQVSDKMLALNTNASSIFNGKILQKAAIIGHSMGGGASFLAAANNTNIETVIGFAPAETNPSAIDAAANVSCPALVFSGSADGVTPPANHHIPIYNSASSICKSFVSITGGAHCYYANTNFNCDFGENTSSQNISITRAEQQTATYGILDPWLDFKLKGICNAYGAFLLAIESQPGTINETLCPSLPTVTIINDPNQGSDVYCSSLQGNSYQWYMDNQPIVGETSQCYNIPTDLGATYQVEVFFENGCVFSQPITFTSGLNDLTSSQVKLYPNPANQFVTIESDKNEINYLLLDLNGRVIQANQTYSKIHLIEISTLNKGVYHLTISDGLNKITKQFIKE